MSWIKLREDLHDDPAVVTISARCGVTIFHAVGVVARVWAWAGRLSVDGKVPHATAGMIDTITHTPGLADAMQAVGWLIIGESHLRFPKWDRHNGEAAKARAMDAERKRLERLDAAAGGKGKKAGKGKSERPDPVQDSPDARPEKSGRSSDQIRGEERREEEIRGEKNPHTPPAGAGSPPPPASQAPATDSARKPGPKALEPKPEDVPIPPALDTPEFRALFGEWLRHRRARAPKDPWTAIAAERKLAHLAKLGLAEATRWVNFALDEGLKNIREPYATTGTANGQKRNGFHRPTARERFDADVREGLDEVHKLFHGTEVPA